MSNEIDWYRSQTALLLVSEHILEVAIIDKIE